MVGRDVNMDITTIRKAISTPISVDQPVGDSATNDALYEFVEDQMMKVGSLSHGSVQWDKAEQALVKLLSEKTKDLKLLTYLFQCFHNRNTPSSFILSIFVLADFMSEYWEICFPFSGKKGSLPRRKFLGQIIQRFGLALDKVDFNKFSAEQRELQSSANVYWQAVIKEKGLESDNIETLIEAINRKLKKSEKSVSIDTEENESTPEVKSPHFNAKSASVPVDYSSSKATKHTLLKLADFLSENENGIDLALRIRRYAVWSTITSLPDHSKNQTLISALPQERIKEYWGLLENPDFDLWKRVETTLTVAPYWFDGQFLSYQIAEKLGFIDCAQAILTETQNFLQRFPQLYKFTFKDGELFVSDVCRNWLEQVDDTEIEDSNLGGDSWGERKKMAIGLAKTEGVGAALLMINDGISKAVEPRDNYYWRLISSELLQESKLNDLAQQQFQQLHTQVQSMSVSEWEPSLLKRVKKYITAK